MNITHLWYLSSSTFKQLYLFANDTYTCPLAISSCRT